MFRVVHFVALICFISFLGIANDCVAGAVNYKQSEKKREKINQKFLLLSETQRMQITKKCSDSVYRKTLVNNLTGEQFVLNGCNVELISTPRQINRFCSYRGKSGRETYLDCDYYGNGRDLGLVIYFSLFGKSSTKFRDGNKCWNYRCVEMHLKGKPDKCPDYWCSKQ